MLQTAPAATRPARPGAVGDAALGCPVEQGGAIRALAGHDGVERPPARPAPRARPGHTTTARSGGSARGRPRARSARPAGRRRCRAAARSRGAAAAAWAGAARPKGPHGAGSPSPTSSRRPARRGPGAACPCQAGRRSRPVHWARRIRRSTRVSCTGASPAHRRRSSRPRCNCRPVSGRRAAAAADPTNSSLGRVAPSARHSRQHLQDDPVRQRGRDLCVVVGRGDLDDVHADDRQVVGDPAHGVEQLPRRQPTRLGSAGARAWPRQTSMSTDRNTPS